ncbi:MAG: hypothetical protein PHQ35_08610 [Phycisphaerae bacterium]|nr:hypothetical protein [Phycisphaerae bacterium]MDD5381551.1 hypothetical protein [Phycisphaerae bacterium]
MSDQALSSIIAAAALCVGTVVGAVIKYILNLREIRKNKEAIQQKDTTIIGLQKQIREILDLKVEQAPRKISYQLQILDDEISKIQESGHKAEVSILGINATGPLHQGRELLVNLLVKEGRLRVLLLDPRKPVFEERCNREDDTVGRIAAELYASLYILMDITLKAGIFGGNIEIRLHEKYPDRSLLMLNHRDKDGVILANPYPSSNGSRGMDGQMYPLIKQGRTTDGYNVNVQYYENLWDEADPIKLRIPQKRHRITDWPF